MKTVTVIIGNSDDKLSQSRWSAFVNCVALRIGELAKQVHFSGSSSNSAPWQNHAWVFEIDDKNAAVLSLEIALEGNHFDKNTVAWIEGKTEFI